MRPAWAMFATARLEARCSRCDERGCRALQTPAGKAPAMTFADRLACSTFNEIGLYIEEYIEESGAHREIVCRMVVQALEEAFRRGEACGKQAEQRESAKALAAPTVGVLQ